MKNLKEKQINQISGIADRIEAKNEALGVQIELD